MGVEGGVGGGMVLVKNNIDKCVGKGNSTKNNKG